MLLEAGFRTNRIYNLDVLDFFGFKIPMSTESLSLFWEFKENVTLDGAMICAFCYVNGYEKRVIQSTRLLIFYFAIYLRLNKLSKDLIPATELFKLDDVLSKELDNCNKVLDRLKRVKAGTISIFDMMTMSFDSFVQMLNNKKHLEACVKFRSSLAQKNKGILNYYDYAVKVRIDLAVEKRKVLDGAYYYFNEALQLVLGTMYFESLPDEIMWNILSYLNVRELKKLANIDTLTS
ncbi:uncharacterized protein LOC106636475 [Copidosoma floridanum]|uniref:uncharacterized protein LOC106636475 n=1 Tax=Copidosoma floridanum TaxID=29053 RepID=UPI0006C959FB|nr:uncharacterized protein LOC106636475 [Copidosoma floridanum]